MRNFGKANIGGKVVESGVGKCRISKHASGNMALPSALSLVRCQKNMSSLGPSAFLAKLQKVYSASQSGSQGLISNISKVPVGLITRTNSRNARRTLLSFSFRLFPTM